MVKWFQGSNSEEKKYETVTQTLEASLPSSFLSHNFDTSI